MKINIQFSEHRKLDICIVHTVVLYQSLVGVYSQTEHVKY
jgi:hypothetical protein